jgi:heme-degrading monooxygenase HmoA
MFMRIWQLRARADKNAEFRECYGPGGAWAVLFRRGAGYLGTELFESTTEAASYLAVDRWESAEAWQKFLRAWSEDYAALDEMCHHLTVTEAEIGAFRVQAS